MVRPKRWTITKMEHGMWVIKLSSWKWLHDFVHQQMLEYEHYIWRGQRNQNWKLEPSFDRETVNKSKVRKEQLLRKQLDDFKYAVRGRRGENPGILETDNDWWALGQHHGLATPLLDWTHSPFVALYFAFHKNTPPQSQYRAVYAVSPESLQSRSVEIMEEFDDYESKCEFIKPLADDNPRLVNQGGIFSRLPIGLDMESLMRNFYEKSFNNGVMIKILIPNTGRAECLKTLNRMNINHSTLFPDIYGSSEFCNTKLRIDKY